MATKKYPLGIAFSGGGARAAAHCGALQALKEYGIQPVLNNTPSLQSVYFCTIQL